MWHDTEAKLLLLYFFSNLPQYKDRYFSNPIKKDQIIIFSKAVGTTPFKSHQTYN